MVGLASPPSQAATFSGLVWRLRAASSIESPAEERAQFRISGATNASVLRGAIILRSRTLKLECRFVAADTQCHIMWRDAKSQLPGALKARSISVASAK